MMSVMFPDKLDVSSYFTQLSQLGMKDWRIKEKNKDPSPLPQLPRFFSHPNVDSMEGVHLVNHFYERHKIFSILAHALCHNPQLAFLSDKLPSFAHYMRPILVANRPISIANHLFLYKEYAKE